MQSTSRSRSALGGSPHRWLLGCGLAAAMLMLPLAGSAAAAPARSGYARYLDGIDARLVFAIEIGPAELGQDLGFTEALCGAAEDAEAAGELPRARYAWLGIRQVVRRSDLRLVATIERTFRHADRRLVGLENTFAAIWRGRTERVQALRSGVGETRGGILRLLHVMRGVRGALGHILRHDCESGRTEIATSARMIPRGLVRINSGMGRLWLLEPAEMPRPQVAARMP